VADRILTAAAALVAAHPGTAWPCCEFTALTLGLPKGDLAWRAVNIWDPTEPWSGPRAVAERGGEYAWVRGVEHSFRPGRWYLCQGWRQLSGPVLLAGGRAVDPTLDAGKGHSWLWCATSPTHGVVLDSSTTRGPRLGGLAYTGTQALPAGRPWAERVAAYPAGVAVALLPGAP
jgi:hypothetical protein